MLSSRLGLFVLGAALLMPAAAADAHIIKVAPGVVTDSNAKLINISAGTNVFHKYDSLKFSVLRAKPGTCAEVRLTLDGKTRTQKDVSFPWTFEIAPNDPIYPTKSAKLEMVIEGVAGCTGRVAYTFAYNASTQGVVDGIVMSGFGGTTPDLATATLQVHGMCRFRVVTFESPWESHKSSPIELVSFDTPTRLPITVPTGA